MGTSFEVTREDGGTLQAYRAEPQSNAAGMVLVIQEIFGVNAHIRSVCDRFAEAGYVAIAPALFDRVTPNVELHYTPEGIERGKELMGSIEFDSALADIRSTLTTAGAEPAKTAVVGYCWGGSLAFASAARLGNQLACAISYYPGGIANQIGEELAAPVLFHFGSQDQTIPMDIVEKVREHYPDQQLHVYDAGHGFNCDARGSYDSTSADLAYQRTLDFIKNQMG